MHDGDRKKKNLSKPIITRMHRRPYILHEYHISRGKMQVHDFLDHFTPRSVVHMCRATKHACALSSFSTQKNYRPCAFSCHLSYSHRLRCCCCCCCCCCRCRCPLPRVTGLHPPCVLPPRFLCTVSLVA
jgi:hypothetical protein